jgi:hypothetical protein
MKFVAPLFLLVSAALLAEQPVFNQDGQLQRPANVREWIYLSSGLGMQYAAEGGGPQTFTNVFAEPTAYREFLKTGKWPEGAMLGMEVRKSVTEGSINKGGFFQTDLQALEVTVKDSKRFPKDGWDYFAFNGNAQTAKAIGQQAGCNACHNRNAAVENTFVQFYPTLIEVAKSKGTFKTTDAK